MSANFLPSGGDVLPMVPTYLPIERHPSTIKPSFEGAPDALSPGGYYATYDPAQMADMTCFQATTGLGYPQTGMYDALGYMIPAQITVQALPEPVAGAGTQSIVATQTLVHNERQVTASPPFVQEKSTRGTRGVDIACTNCRAVKNRCSEYTPCLTCIKYDKADTCVRAERKIRASGSRRGPQATQDPSLSEAHPTPSEPVLETPRNIAAILSSTPTYPPPLTTP